MSLDVLTLIDTGLVAGGGKDDCVCYSGLADSRTGVVKKDCLVEGLPNVIKISYGNISSKEDCKDLCCGAHFPFGIYKYKVS